MNQFPVSRRDVLKSSSAAAAFALANFSLPEFAFPAQGDDEQLVPFLNMPRSRPNMLDWETLDEWITPQEQVFNVQHYGTPEFDAAKHTLQVTGLVDKPQSFTMDHFSRSRKKTS